MKVSKKMKKNILNAISNINHILNENITIHIIEKTICPDCDYDPVRKSSTDVRCKTCGGDGYIEIDNSLTIPVSLEQKEDIEPIDERIVGVIKTGNIIVTFDKKEIETYSLDLAKINKFTWKGREYKKIARQDNYLEGEFYETVLELELA